MWLREGLSAMVVSSPWVLRLLSNVPGIQPLVDHVVPAGTRRELCRTTGGHTGRGPRRAHAACAHDDAMRLLRLLGGRRRPLPLGLGAGGIRGGEALIVLLELTVAAIAQEL